MCRINPKVDIAFKKLFGSEENKDILISFINSVLSPDEQIKEITLKNPYNLSDYMSGKLSILDIKAEDENGKLYDIEMQIGEQGYYGKRALYYWGKTYTNQIDSGEMYSKLKKTVVISIFDFNYFNDKVVQRFHRAIIAKDRDTNIPYEELDCFELHFIELQKFHKKLSHLQTSLDRWVTFLTKAYEYDKNNIPEELAKDIEIKKAIEQLDILYLDKKEQEIYEAEQKAVWDEKEKIRTAEAKGKMEGKIEGKIEGKMEGKMEGKIEGKAETALKLKNLGVSIDVIVESTGLSKTEIKKL